jgi:6-pyruvoyltetrahydropterin/6-carboxytetrahydropterin synthase
MSRYEVARSFYLHASHAAVAGDDRCRRVHGHTFKITLGCQAETVADTGFSVDFFDFDAVIEECREVFDHSHLNDQISNPTCEYLAEHLYRIAAPKLPSLAWIEVEEVGIGTVRVRFS